jgi:hypothetical protein
VQPPCEALRLTLSQALALLEAEKPDDPHKGGIPVESLSEDELRELCEV